MKHKYVFSKDTTTGEVLIREYAELSKEIFSPVCETVYEVAQFEKALSQGPAALLAKMRTRNFYPPGSFSEKIVLGISDMISSDGQGMIEMFLDDADFLANSLDSQEAFEDIEDDENETRENFIEEDLPDTFDEKLKTSNVNSSDLEVEADALDAEDA